MSPSYPGAAAKPGRGRRPFLLAALLAAGVVVPAAVPVAAPVAVAERRSSWAPVEPRSPRVPALWMPVTGPLVRGFDARAGRYGPGHRGIDIAAPVGELVRAPTAGRVVFAGPVAGVNWVTLVVAPGCW
jgi:murein DD-endopeptidase MepM/ murein hydrolase activator NlpD